MSGYASEDEVRRIVKATLRKEGRDPKYYNVSGIMRDAFYHRGPGYGYGAREETVWHVAVAAHRRNRKTTAYREQRKRLTRAQNRKTA